MEQVMSGSSSQPKVNIRYRPIRLSASAGFLAFVVVLAMAFAAHAQQSKAPGTRVEEHCINGRDDDGDGRIDCDDSECRLKAVCITPIENCVNGRDDDQDGRIDCDDRDCEGLKVCVAPIELCTNGKDDDNDGRIDCEDRDCAGTSWCSKPASLENCSNGKDDDGDGLTDCADIDCAAAIACVESCQAEPPVSLDGPGKALLNPSRTLQPLQKK